MRHRIAILAVLSAFILGGCAMPTPTLDAQASNTAMAHALRATMTALAPTATATLLPTDIPTRTLNPTATPTCTPNPTPTPTCSVTPESRQIGPEVQEYVSTVTSTLSSLSNASEKFVELAGNPRLGNAAWTNDICGEWVMISLACLVLRDIDPPEGIGEVHKVLIESGEHYQRAMKYLTEGHESSAPCGQFMGSVDVETLEKVSEQLLAGKPEGGQTARDAIRIRSTG